MKIRKILKDLICKEYGLALDDVDIIVINDTHSAILQEFLSWLPEEKHSGTSYDYGQIQEQGFNQCLAQIKRRIKEEGKCSD